jgi:hypothetical protein
MRLVDAVTRVYDAPGKVIELHSHKPRTLLRGYYKTKLTANSCIARSTSTNAVSISSARTMKRFP